MGDLFENENQQEVVPVEIDSDDNITPKIRALLNIMKSSAILRETLGSLMRSENSLKIEQNDSGQATIFGVPIQVLGSDSLKKEIVFII